MANQQIAWKFVARKPPGGGFLGKNGTGNEKKPQKGNRSNYEELRTLMEEVEGVINARPLTYVQNDDEGVGHALSPSHLMYGRRITSLPNHSHFEIISTFQILTRQMKNHNRLLEQFTKRWREDYLVNLREVHSQKKKGRSACNIAVGDVVVLKDDFTKRMFWKLAVVEEPLMGRDRQV